MESKLQNMGGTDPMDLYVPLEVMGEGVFGEVLKCLKKETGQTVAVKKVKIANDTSDVIQRELFMLKMISSLDPDEYNIVRFNKYFQSGSGQHCMEFEMLDRSVFDLMRQRTTPLSLMEIRPMAQQLLVALFGLQSLGVMHTDIKSDNIMLVDHEKEPFKVKLIDFGLGILKRDARIGMCMQPLLCRAPEVILGLPLSEAMDMWSLGCCLLEWYLRCYPFNAYSSYDILKQTCNVFGFPNNDLITRAKRGTDFFVKEGSQWRLKNSREYEESKGVAPQMRQSLLQDAADLEELILNDESTQSGLEIEDRSAFLDLLKKMFAVNPETRITPAEALQHPFITMSHILEALNYADVSIKTMTLQPTLHSRQGQANPNEAEQPFTSVPLPSSYLSPPSSSSDENKGDSGSESALILRPSNSSHLTPQSPFPSNNGKSRSEGSEEKEDSSESSVILPPANLHHSILQSLLPLPFAKNREQDIEEEEDSGTQSPVILRSSNLHHSTPQSLCPVNGAKSTDKGSEEEKDSGITTSRGMSVSADEESPVCGASLPRNSQPNFTRPEEMGFRGEMPIIFPSKDLQLLRRAAMISLCTTEDNGSEAKIPIILPPKDIEWVRQAVKCSQTAERPEKMGFRGEMPIIFPPKDLRWLRRVAMIFLCTTEDSGSGEEIPIILPPKDIEWVREAVKCSQTVESGDSSTCQPMSGLQVIQQQPLTSNNNSLGGPVMENYEEENSLFFPLGCGILQPVLDFIYSPFNFWAC